MYGRQQLADHKFCDAMTAFLEKGDIAIAGTLLAVLYLIRWDAHPSDRSSSLSILPFQDMLNMFYVHEATDPKDKIYALLGMIVLEDPSDPIVVEYSKGWGSVFSDLIRRVFGQTVSVRTWDHRLVALIKAKACVLERVWGVTRLVGTSTYTFNIKQANLSVWPLGVRDHWNLRCSIHGTRSGLQDGDLMIHTRGAERPMIIRERSDHFDVISISVTILAVWTRDQRTGPRHNMEWSAQFSQLSYTYELPLVWDWSYPTVSSQKNQAPFLVDRDLGPDESSPKARFDRITNLAKLYDDTNDRNHLMELKSCFVGGLNAILDMKKLPHSYAVLEIVRMLHARDISHDDYEWVRARCLDIPGASPTNLGEMTKSAMRACPPGKIVLYLGLSHLALTEEQFGSLLLMIKFPRENCERRENVLVALLHPQSSFTEAVVARALELKGPLIKAILSEFVPAPTVTQEMLMAAAQNTEADLMFEVLFRHYPQTNFSDTAFVTALAHIRSNILSSREGLPEYVQLFMRICARVLARVQFDGEAMSQLLGLVLYGGRTRFRDGWDIIFRPYANEIVYCIDQKGMCDFLNIPSPSHRFGILESIYGGYRDHAWEALSSISFPEILERAKEQAIEIWPDVGAFSTWKIITCMREPWQASHGTSPGSRRPAREVVLESVRAWLLAERLFGKTGSIQTPDFQVEGESVKGLVIHRSTEG